MFDIITVGSGLVDIFVETGNKLFQQVKKGNSHDVVHVPFGEKIQVKDVRVFTGGGGSNTAVAFSLMGFKTGFIGLLGNDANADMVSKEFTKNKVAQLLKARANKLNGFSVILDAKGHDRTILTYKGPCDELKKEFLPNSINTKWLYCASMMGESMKTEAMLAQYAKKNRIKVMFNPSFYMAQQGLKALSPILKNADICICNREEAAMLVKGSIEQMLKKIALIGPKIVIITDGSKSTFLLSNKKVFQVTPHPIKVVESTGAGDAFASGFLAAYIKTGTIELSLQVALANAQSVISHFGAKHKLLIWKEAMQTIKKRPAKLTVKVIA